MTVVAVDGIDDSRSTVSQLGEGEECCTTAVGVVVLRWKGGAAMAMQSTAFCCPSSSPHGRPHPHRLHLRLLLTAATTTNFSSPARIRLVSCSAPSQRNPLPVSSESAPDVAGEDTYEGKDLTAAGGREVEEGRDERYGFEMDVRKLPGKKNRWLVRARVRVGAPLEAIWATLTDYEGLAGFIPGLSECPFLHQDAAFARL